MNYLLEGRYGDDVQSVLAELRQLRGHITTLEALAVPCHLSPSDYWAPRCGAPQSAHNLLTSVQIEAVTCVACLRAELSECDTQ